MRDEKVLRGKGKWEAVFTDLDRREEGLGFMTNMLFSLTKISSRRLLFTWHQNTNPIIFTSNNILPTSPTTYHTVAFVNIRNFS
jgi:hypothetical protein